MPVAVIQYNAGNVQSVLFALERLGIQSVLTADADAIRRADKVIFPGQGHAAPTMAYLRTHGLDVVITSLKQPVLGICIGQQLLCSHSEEGDTPCLGVFPERVKLFPQVPNHKVPHMGWNQLQVTDHPLFDNLPPQPEVYFVHSYYVERGPNAIATCDYITPFAAAVHRDNFYAVQFHPEKSGAVGQRILQNFLSL